MHTAWAIGLIPHKRRPAGGDAKTEAGRPLRLPCAWAALGRQLRQGRAASCNRRLARPRGSKLGVTGTVTISNPSEKVPLTCAAHLPRPRAPQAAPGSASEGPARRDAAMGVGLGRAPLHLKAPAAGGEEWWWVAAVMLRTRTPDG